MGPRLEISIHAPLAGCDGIRIPADHKRKDFNPRTPCGVRQSGDSGKIMHSFISIHAPLAGCDNEANATFAKQNISIHAPLAGCDKKQKDKDRNNKNFNPRTPCGVRHHPSKDRPKDAEISIHAPLAGCDLDQPQKYQYQPISIHAPLAGCDGQKYRWRHR